MADAHEKLLSDFKALLPAELDEYLSDDDCLRFLRARKKNAEKAAEMAIEWWSWFNKAVPAHSRGNVTPKDILNPVEDINEDIFIRLTPHSNCGTGKYGHPIYWEQTGLISTRFADLNKQLSIDDLVVRHIRQQEIAVARMKHCSTAERPVTSQIIVMNLMSLSYKLDTKALSTFKQTLIIDQNFYPERLHVLFMINAPW